MLLGFTVDRATWLHGEGGSASYLHRASDGKKCCLGFMCRAAGVPKQYVTGQRATWKLEYVPKIKELLPALFLSEYHADVTDLMRYNDDVGLDDGYREFKLIEGFKAIGLRLMFTGSYT